MIIQVTNFLSYVTALNLQLLQDGALHEGVTMA